jgi:hypothetical protein
MAGSGRESAPGSSWGTPRLASATLALPPCRPDQGLNLQAAFERCGDDIKVRLDVVFSLRIDTRLRDALGDGTLKAEHTHNRIEKPHGSHSTHEAHDSCAGDWASSYYCTT